jgi:uncharacterized coiled-coil protein SlyX
MPDEFKHLSKDDLFLLMESYRNMIQLHSTLVEQQKSIMELQHTLIAKQDNISMKQVKTCDQLALIASKLDDCSNNLIKTNDNIQLACNNIDKNINGGIETVKDKMNGNQVEITKQHSGITNRVYIAMGLMGTIVIALIGLSVQLSR